MMMALFAAVGTKVNSGVAVGVKVDGGVVVGAVGVENGVVTAVEQAKVVDIAKHQKAAITNSRALTILKLIPAVIL
jgi:hypothetical protein